MSFIAELKRRNVFRVGIAYTVAAWLLIQVVETLFPVFGLPDAAIRVVVIALAISLVEAFWMLPAHVVALGVNFDRPSRVHRYRERFTHWVQIRYVRLLVIALRHRWKTLLLVTALFVGAVALLIAGQAMGGGAATISSEDIKGTDGAPIPGSPSVSKRQVITDF